MAEYPDRAPNPVDAIDHDTLWDVKGDLAVAQGDNQAVRLARGADGQVLLTDSSTPTGLKWGTISTSSPGTTYIHTQSTLAAVWVITHNLGQYPSVTVVDTGGTIILPDVHYDSAIQITVTFAAPTSGKAYLN